VREDGSIVGTVGGGAMESKVIEESLESLRDGKSRLKNYSLNNLEDGDPGVCGGSAQIFIEPVLTAPTLLVVGAGHVGKAVAELGKWLGFRVLISDDREGFCTPDYLPGMDGYLACPAAEIVQHTKIDRQTYVAAVTRGLPVDIHLIPALLATDAAYIGLIGSRRRWALTIKELQEKHQFTEAQLARVHAPIGLELNAETPKEIAVSIMAEIIMIRRGGTGEPMKWLGNITEADAE
jgi:xanthine dehydrogenase accessory factor